MFSLSPSASRRACASLLALLAFPAVAVAARPNAEDRPAPYPGGSHAQWVREVFTWEQGLPPAGVSAVAQTREGKVYVTSGGTLLRRNDSRWAKENGPLGVTALYVPEKTVSLPSEEKKPPAIELVAGAEDGVWLLVSGRWRKDGAESPAGVTVLTQAPDESLWALAPAGKSAGLWRRTAEGWSKGPVLATDMGKLRDFAPTADGALYAATENGLFILEREGQWAAVAPKEGSLLSADTRALEALGPHYTLIATDKGFNITNGRRGWQKYSGAEGLPIEEITQAVVEPSGATWLGTPHGVVRWHEGRWNYFAGPRWLPDDKVLTLAPGQDGVWVGTAKGLARLYTRRLGLVRKAELYQRDLEQRPRREGFVTVTRLRQPGDFAGALQEISDNDGLWTAMYVASQAFRYGTNRSSEAKDQARRSMQAVLRLESITGIPGFPARAISSLGEPGHETRSKGEWHPSPSEPNYMWKGDTS